MKMSMLIAAMTLVGTSAFARPAICTGQEGTVGQIQVSLNGADIQVAGQYGFRDTATGRMSNPTTFSCTGHLSNNGQAGISTHDYYELHGNCGVQYIRTEKDQTGRLTGWVSLVKRGAPGFDSSGYEYNFFVCQ